MIDTIMDGAKCVNLQDNFSLSNFQHDYVKPAVPFFLCWKMDKWASTPSKRMGAKLPTMIEMHFNSNQIFST